MDETGSSQAVARERERRARDDRRLSVNRIVTFGWLFPHAVVAVWTAIHFPSGSIATAALLVVFVLPLVTSGRAGAVQSVFLLLGLGPAFWLERPPHAPGDPPRAALDLGVLGWAHVRPRGSLRDLRVSMARSLLQRWLGTTVDVRFVAPHNLAEAGAVCLLDPFVERRRWTPRKPRRQRPERPDHPTP